MSLPLKLHEKYGNPEFWKELEHRVEAFDRNAPACLKGNPIPIKPSLHNLPIHDLFVIRAEAERLIQEADTGQDEAFRRWYAINAKPYLYGRCYHGTIGCAATSWPHTECVFPRWEDGSVP